LKRIVIAIDGPAASGKSTTARLVAARLGYLHIDTGAMYRAITLKALQQGLNVNERAKIEALAHTCEILFRNDAGSQRVILDGVDVSAAVRMREVTANVSTVSSYPGVREVLVREQRKIAAQGGVVLEGRDIGTVVLPGAELKVFMVANVHERARRRKEDLMATGIQANEDELVHELETRDRKDSTRAASPMRKADDAIELDTSNLTIDQQVEFIVQRAQAKMR